MLGKIMLIVLIALCISLSLSCDKNNIDEGVHVGILDTIRKRSVKMSSGNESNIKTWLGRTLIVDGIPIFGLGNATRSEPFQPIGKKPLNHFS
jgi:hypothetical protein